MIEVDGIVDNNIRDIYNFDSETIADKTIFKPFRRMATEGDARPFLIFGSRVKRLRGFIEVENGKIKSSNFKWEKINQ